MAEYIFETDDEQSMDMDTGIDEDIVPCEPLSFNEEWKGGDSDPVHEELENTEWEMIDNKDLFESPEISTDLAQQIFEECNFDPACWNSLTNSEKLETLNQLEGNLAELQERNPVEIKFKDMNSLWDTLKGRMSYGYYDPNTEVMYINSSLLNSPATLPDVIDTVVHEGIHAYQHQCINGEVEHYDQAQVAEWAENFKNYKSASKYGMEVYLNQPVEVFARENAGKITDSLTLLIA